MKKTIFSVVVSLGILVGTLGTVTSYASEIMPRSNHSDTTFNFVFTPGLFGSTVYTGKRYKDDATSAYMKVNSRSKAQKYTANVVDEHNNNFSQTWYVEISTIGVDYYIPNNAFEDRGSGVNVKIRCYTGDLLGFDASGVWSPDSV